MTLITVTFNFIITDNDSKPEERAEILALYIILIDLAISTFSFFTFFHLVSLLEVLGGH